MNETLSDIRNGRPLDKFSGVSSKKTSEMDEIVSKSTTGAITAEFKSVNACPYMEMWFTAYAENLAGGDTLSVKFYKVFGSDRVLGETVSVTVPAVTKNTAVKADVETVSASLESYDYYTVEGTITVVAGGSVTVLVGKKSQG